jgi:hypothetical protein
MLPQRLRNLELHATTMAPHPCTSCYPNDNATLYVMLPQRHRTLVLHATPNDTASLYFMLPQWHRILVLHATPTTPHPYT